MNNKNSKHFLDETVQRAKIENAQREAEQIYNYNKWKDNHEKMVEHEVRKRQHQEPSAVKCILIGILLALAIEIIYILIINDPETLLTAFQAIKQKFGEIWEIIINLTIPKYQCYLYLILLCCKHRSMFS